MHFSILFPFPLILSLVDGGCFCSNEWGFDDGEGTGCNYRQQGWTCFLLIKSFFGDVACYQILINEAVRRGDMTGSK